MNILTQIPWPSFFLLSLLPSGWQIDHSRRGCKLHKNPSANPSESPEAEARQNPRRVVAVHRRALVVNGAATSIARDVNGIKGGIFSWTREELGRDDDQQLLPDRDIDPSTVQLLSDMVVAERGAQRERRRRLHQHLHGEEARHTLDHLLCHGET